MTELRPPTRRAAKSPTQRADTQRPPRGMTFVEVLTVLTVVGILFAMSAPSFVRTVEQAHADMAGANLQAIWNAERFYWLENRGYTTNLAALEALGLLDPSIVSGTSRYSFSITFADDVAFTATATRINSNRWNGKFQIQETGTVSGVVQATGHPDIALGFD